MSKKHQPLDLFLASPLVFFDIPFHQIKNRLTFTQNALVTEQFALFIANLVAIDAH